MYRHLQKNVVYIAHPKTGSSSASHVMVNNGEWEHVGSHHDMPNKLNVQYAVSVVRHPMDWLVSWYFHVKATQPFDQWIEQFTNPLLNRSRDHWFGVRASTHIIFFEHLQAGFDHAFDHIGISRIKIPHRNASKDREGRHYTEFFNQRATQAFLARYDKLLQLYQELYGQRGRNPCLIKSRSG